MAKQGTIKIKENGPNRTHKDKRERPKIRLTHICTDGRPAGLIVHLWSFEFIHLRNVDCWSPARDREGEQKREGQQYAGTEDKKDDGEIERERERERGSEREEGQQEREREIWINRERPSARQQHNATRAIARERERERQRVRERKTELERERERETK